MTPTTRSSCKHATWLHAIGHENGFGLLVTRRPRELMNQVSLPPERCPRLLMLLGRQNRVSAVRTLWQSAGVPASHRGLQMHLDPHSVFEAIPPLILVQGDLEAGLTPARDLCNCQHTCHAVVPQQEERSLSIFPHAVLCARIVSPFAEVVYIFLSDYRDIETVVDAQNTLSVGAT